jgi:ABC-type oligopeptide transport system substrate-binding subunit
MAFLLGSVSTGLSWLSLQPSLVKLVAALSGAGASPEMVASVRSVLPFYLGLDLLLSTLVTYFVLQLAVGRPLGAMESAVDQIARLDLASPLAPSGGPLLSRLQSALARMAQALLADAGYANGGGLKVDYTWVTGEEDGRKAAELWQANLKQLGVTLNIREISITTFEDQIKDPKTASDIQAHYWEPDYADVTAIMNLMYHSKMKEPNGPNYSFYGNPQVDALLDKIPSELDNTKRVDLIKQAQTLVLQDAPDLWVAYVPLLVAARKDVQGYTYHPFFEWNVNYANIHK